MDVLQRVQQMHRQHLRQVLQAGPRTSLVGRLDMSSVLRHVLFMRTEAEIHD